MCRINQANPVDRMKAETEKPITDRLQRVIDHLNGGGPDQVIKINFEIPIVNATKYLASIRDFLSTLIPKDKPDGSN